MALESINVGRPKKGLPADSQEPRVAIIHLKGSPTYAEWLDEAHKKTHIAKATIFRVAVAEWAERNGLSKPPEI